MPVGDIRNLLENPAAKAKRQLVELAERKALIEKVKEEPFETFTELGVECRYQPFYTDRHRDVVQIYLNGELWADEETYTPWSIFKPTTVCHEIYLCFATQGMVEDLLRTAKVKGRPMDNPYAPPHRWNAILGEDMIDVVKVYKALMKQREKNAAKKRH